jgi:hypothetical protein
MNKGRIVELSVSVALAFLATAMGYPSRTMAQTFPWRRTPCRLSALSTNACSEAKLLGHSIMAQADGNDRAGIGHTDSEGPACVCTLPPRRAGRRCLARDQQRQDRSATADRPRLGRALYAVVGCASKQCRSIEWRRAQAGCGRRSSESHRCSNTCRRHGIQSGHNHVHRFGWSREQLLSVVRKK